MSLKDLGLKSAYRSLDYDSISDAFLIPALKEATEYKRSVGYFTLGAFIELYDGIDILTNYNGGAIKLITSPKLTKEDYELIKDAYDRRDSLIEENMLRSFDENYSDIEKSKIAKVFDMIVKRKIEIKIVLTDTLGIYHDKLGILKDSEKNVVAFYGSLNETKNAFTQNYEKVRLAFSWDEGYGAYETLNEDNEFDSIWFDNNPYLKSYDFPNAVKEKMIKFVEKEFSKLPSEVLTSEKEKPVEIIPAPREYQEEAIKQWQNNNYKGILAMATGTGKTLTAIFALNHLFENKRDSKFVILSVPHNILIEQWKADLKKFDYNIVCISSEYPNWLKNLQTKIALLNYDKINNLIAITTIASMMGEKFNLALKKVKKEIVFVGDEVHNFGAFQTHKFLPEKAKYRLGLSATPKRHFDDFGNKMVEKYFDKIVYEFSLERAIKERFLVPYEYYSVVVYLDEEEQKKYDALTDKVIKLLNIKSESDIENASLDEQTKNLLISRARIVAIAKQKVPELLKLIDKTDKYKNLIYCGVGNIVGDEETFLDSDVNKQIDLVVTELSKKGVWSAQYTSQSSKEEKKYALESFEKDKISTLVAIKCLDEGVNIPSVNRAFILASSTNPKEFIQRRGRVLRTSSGKDKAIIYDFVTLPHVNAKHSSGLIKKETSRVEEFSALALNKEQSEKLCKEIKNIYN